MTSTHSIWSPLRLPAVRRLCVSSGIYFIGVQLTDDGADYSFEYIGNTIRSVVVF